MQNWSTRSFHDVTTAEPAAELTFEIQEKFYSHFFFFIFKFWFYFYCAPKLILIQKAEIRFVFFSFVFTFAVYFQASQQGSYIEEKDRNS
jgi:hypothetical protein